MKANVDAVDSMRYMTVHVKIVRFKEMEWRLWLGTRLFMLGAWVMNCNVEVTGPDRTLSPAGEERPRRASP